MSVTLCLDKTSSHSAGCPNTSRDVDREGTHPNGPTSRLCRVAVSCRAAISWQQVVGELGHGGCSDVSAVGFAQCPGNSWNGWE
ncbi:hypothetical protein GRJ2_001214700 [Grus japonensis]|uniref:Uncharacterized protein n=1 Tax=Grus japonensis TaxID=30415 RepID=A0ABC9WRT7_GRUJA